MPITAAARTEYRNINPEEHAWLISYLFKVLCRMATLSNTTVEDLKQLRDTWWRKRRSTLPRGRSGQNTPESMVAGILENMLYSDAPQRDFTAKQCEAIEEISNWMSALDDREFDTIRFAIKIA